MSAQVEPLQLLSPLSLTAASDDRSATGSGMADAFAKLLGDTDSKVNTANLEVQKLAVGKAESLHGVMIAIESAKNSLELVVQIRNRLVDAYQDILKMQI